MKKLLTLLAALLPLAVAAQDLVRKVDTTIGTEYAGFASGYNVPGATRPFGMVQFTSPITGKDVGFVCNQLATGGPHLGNFPVLPMKGGIADSPRHMTDGRVRVTSEKGHAGFYEATVDRDILVELTATTRTGIARFSFPEGSGTNSVIIGGGISTSPIEVGAISVTGPRSCEGYAKGCMFCGWCDTPYTVYFAAEFDRDACETGVWKQERLSKGGSFSEGKDSGAYFTFDSDGKPVRYKFAISYVSVENAKLNLKTENPGWDFDAVRADCEAEWERYLSLIEVKGADESRLTQFYTHLYRVFAAPSVFSDVNGEYIGSDMKIHSSPRTTYTNFSNWDTYRTQIQLLSMLTPEIASDIILSLEEYADQAGGAFPRWVLAGIETGVMQGDPTALLIANAWAFGARGFSEDRSLALMRKNAETPGLMCQNVEVRPGLADYLGRGYVEASLQLEYTSADFAISQFLAATTNDCFSQADYRARAAKWHNLFNPENGWIQCKNPDGSWKPFSYDWKEYMEASYKAYFWMVPYDLHGLIKAIGGKDAALARLDELFRGIDASPFEDWYAAGNEPSFHIPWIYNWAGRPDRTSEELRRILRELYYIGPAGVPGNDDMGTMGAWYVFTCLGLYPMVPGVGGFTLNTPVFDSATLHLPGGDLKINGGSENAIYTKSLKVNGKDWDKAWIDYADWIDGGELTYKTATKPTSWATTILPPEFM